MPGDFVLGCLLGQYDRAQSFDVATGSWGATNINSWVKTNFTQSSMSPDISRVHSSGLSLLLRVFSETAGAGGVYVSYDHSVNDIFTRWFPDVTTHALRLQGWAHAAAAAYSGGLSMLLRGTGGLPTYVIPYVGGVNSMAVFTLETVTVSISTTAGMTDIIRTNASPTGEEIHAFDSLLPQVDPITLTPEFDFIEESRLPAARHRTQGGVLHTYQWTRHWAWRVPLRFLSNSHADLINWWWVNGFALAFTLDTSDQNTVYTAKITNETQPIGSKIKPYALNAGGWAGVLELESLDQGSLVY